MVSVSGGAVLSAVFPNQVWGPLSSNPPVVVIAGTGLLSQSTIQLTNLTVGGTISVVPSAVYGNAIVASLPVTNSTAMWQVKVLNPVSGPSNLFNFQVVQSGPLSKGQYAYLNDYPYQNAPTCPDGKGGSGEPPCPSDTADPYDFFFRECTSFVAWRMNRDAGTIRPSPRSFYNGVGGGQFGGACGWADNARNLGYQVDSTEGPSADPMPEAGDIAQWTHTAKKFCSNKTFPGHVAYVEAVYAGGVDPSELNAIDVSEYNYNPDIVVAPTDHNFGIRHIKVGDANYPDNFIHIRKMTIQPGALVLSPTPIGTPNSMLVGITNSRLIGAISITGISVPGTSAFTQTNTCSASIPVGGACQITVTFLPSVAGPQNANLQIVGTAGRATIPLNGTGLSPLTITPTSLALNFGNIPLGKTSSPLTVTLQNRTGADVDIYSIPSFAGNFVRTSTTCGTVLKWEKSCAITLAYAPATLGLEMATLSIADSAIGGPQTIQLTGNGIQPPPGKNPH